MKLVCERLSGLDLAAFLASPERSEWLWVREHAAVCDVCRREIEAWTRLRVELARDDEHPAEETLLAYADDPRSVEQDRRRMLESHLGACPSCRDELAVLGSLRIEPAVVGTNETPAPVGAASRVAGHRWPTAFARAARRFLWHPAFAYALVLVVLVPTAAMWLEQSARHEDEVGLDMAIDARQGAGGATEEASMDGAPAEPAALASPNAERELAVDEARRIPLPAAPQVMAEHTAPSRAPAPGTHAGGEERGGADTRDTDARLHALRALTADRGRHRFRAMIPPASEPAAAASGLASTERPAATPEAGVVPAGNARADLESSPPADAATPTQALAAKTRSAASISQSAARIDVSPGERVSVRAGEWASGGELHLRLVPAALAPRAAEKVGVVVPAAVHGIEIRVAGAGREIRDRRSDFVMPPDRVADVTTRLPANWLTPGTYLVTVQVGSSAAAVAAPFQIDVR